MRFERIAIFAFAAIFLLASALVALAGGVDENKGEPAPAMEAATAGSAVGVAEQIEMKVGKLNEAPMLAELVKQGKLPKVEDRLPDNPIVIKPLDGIGQYGGTWRNRNTKLKDGAFHHSQIKYTRLARQKSDGSFTMVPELAESWDLSADKRVWTFTLRKGLRWSDGHPYTTEDIEFFWNDVIRNDTLRSSAGVQRQPAGVIEVVDETTFRLRFEEPYGNFLMLHSLGHNNNVWPAERHPKHYLSQFHEKYADKATLGKLVKESGTPSWDVLYSQKADFRVNIDLPTMEMFIMEREVGEAGFMVWVRNPYYYKVDTEGNQLPYIDRISIHLTTDHEVALLKTIAGEYDYHIGRFRANHYPTLKQNEAKGPYRVGNNPNAKGGEFSLYIEQTTSSDPAISEIFQDVRFRQAVSVALNRQEIVDTVFWGAAEARQTSHGSDSPLFIPEWPKHYAQYDPALANKLLDEMGLDKRDADGYRLRKDGQTLKIRFDWSLERGWDDAYAMVVEFLGNVGIKVISQGHDRGKLFEILKTGASQMSSWSLNPGLSGSYLLPSADGSGGTQRWGGAWRLWRETDGARGEEPPTNVKRIFELYDKSKHAQSPEELKSILNEADRIMMNDLNIIGVMGYDIRPAFVHDRMRNVKLYDVPYGSYIGPIGFTHPEQWWIDQSVAK